MSIKFYIHTPMSDDMSERRAIFRIARLLSHHFPHDDLLLIVNIDPQKTPNIQFRQVLPQLDALLLSPRFMATLDVKNAFDPIEATSLTDPWYGKNAQGYNPVLGGVRDNPYLQARHARGVWAAYLREGTWPFLSAHRLKQLKDAWSHLSSFVLFHPYLHPDSRLPPLGDSSMWFHLCGVDAITELVLTVVDKKLNLGLTEMENLATEAFKATPWTDAEKLLLAEIFGYIYVYEPPDAPVRYPIHCFEDFTIGRASAVVGHRVDPRFERVSRHHLRLEASRHEIKMVDLNSGNGIFAHCQRIEAKAGIRLIPGLKVHLGDPDDTACQIWFETSLPNRGATQATQT